MTLDDAIAALYVREIDNDCETFREGGISFPRSGDPGGVEQAAETAVGSGSARTGE